MAAVCASPRPAPHRPGKAGRSPPAAAQPVPTPAPPPFDVGKFAGIFAAIGLAVGAIGTALASVMTGLFALRWWQMPLALAGLLLVISAPAVVLAWFKLRSRNLGPILDANGWAINARARINIPFGTSLTALAQLPEHAERALTDPYADKPSRWPVYAGVLVLLAMAVVYWWVLPRGHLKPFNAPGVRLRWSSSRHSHGPGLMRLVRAFAGEPNEDGRGRIYAPTSF